MNIFENYNKAKQKFAGSRGQDHGVAGSRGRFYRITGDHGVGSTDHLSRQTMRIKTVMNHNQENDQKNRILW